MKEYLVISKQFEGLSTGTENLVKVISEIEAKAEAITCQYPRTKAAEILLDASSPINIRTIRMRKNELNSMVQLVASPTSVPNLQNSSSASPTQSPFCSQFSDWLKESSLRLQKFSDFQNSSEIISRFSDSKASASKYLTTLDVETDKSRILAAINDSRMDPFIFRTPSSWTKCGFLFITHSLSKESKVWFWPDRSSIPEEISDFKNIEASHFEMEKEYSLVRLAPEMTEYCPFIGEVAGELKLVHFSPFGEGNEEITRSSDDDWKTLSITASWTTIAFVYPDGKKQIEIFPTPELASISFISGTNVNMRERGGKSYEKQRVIAQLNLGTAVRLLEKQDDWYKVKTIFSEKIGWVKEDYIAKRPPLKKVVQEKQTIESLLDSVSIEELARAQPRTNLSGELFSSLTSLSFPKMKSMILSTPGIHDPNGKYSITGCGVFIYFEGSSIFFVPTNYAYNSFRIDLGVFINQDMVRANMKRIEESGNDPDQLIKTMGKISSNEAAHDGPEIKAIDSFMDTATFQGTNAYLVKNNSMRLQFGVAKFPRSSQRVIVFFFYH